MQIIGNSDDWSSNNWSPTVLLYPITNKQIINVSLTINKYGSIKQNCSQEEIENSVSSSVDSLFTFTDYTIFIVFKTPFLQFQ